MELLEVASLVNISGVRGVEGGGALAALISFGCCAFGCFGRS
jgi:hypothetical protein